MASVKHKVGVVGKNWTLLVHAPAWRMLPGVEVHAICTAHRETAEAAAKASQIPRAYWNFEEMASDPELTIIDIGTKPVLRYDMVVTALKAGKHVYNCIPFATSLEQARHMRDLQQSQGRVGVVDAQFRWVPAFRRLKEMITEGALGELFQATLHIQLPLIAYDELVYPYSAHSSGGAAPYLWLADAASGGSAWRNFGSHAVLNLMDLFGEIEEAVGLTATCVREWKMPGGQVLHPDTADFGVALLRFRSGGFANVNVSWCSADGPGYFLELHGSRGRFVLRDPSFLDAPTATLYYGDTRLRDHTGPVGGPVEIPARLYEVPGTLFSKTNAWPFVLTLGCLFADMLQAIEQRREGSPSFAEAAHAHAVVEAVERSMQTRAWVRIASLT